MLRERKIREESGESLNAGILDYRSRATIAVIAGKWKTAIISALNGKHLRFGTLLRCIPKASRKVLTEQLRQLQRDGVVSRVATGARSQCVEYALTEHGRTLIPVLSALANWGDIHLKRMTIEYQPPRVRPETQHTSSLVHKECDIGGSGCAEHL